MTTLCEGDFLLPPLNWEQRSLIGEPACHVYPWTRRDLAAIGRGERRALTWGLPEQTGPADVGQQVVDIGGGLQVLRVHRRLDGSEQSNRIMPKTLQQRFLTITKPTFTAFARSTF